MLRARFGLPSRYLVSPSDVEHLATPTLPAETLCVIANGGGATQTRPALAELVAISNRRAPSATSGGWIVPAGDYGDPAVLYAHLLRGLAAERGYTPLRFRFEYRRQLRLPAKIDVFEQLGLLARGRWGATGLEQVRRALTRQVLGSDLDAPPRLSERLGTPAPTEDRPATVEPTADPGSQPIEGEAEDALALVAEPPSLGPAEEATLVHGASERVSVWLTEIPIEVISDSRMTELTLAGDSTSRQRHASRRDAVINRPNQSVVYVLGHPDMLAALDPEAEISDPVVARWTRTTRAWFKRATHVATLPAPTDRPTTPEVADNFELLTDRDGNSTVLIFEGTRVTLETNAERVAEYRRWVATLTSPPVPEARREGVGSDVVEPDEDQERRDASWREWYRGLTDNDRMLVYSAMTTPEIERAREYFRENVSLSPSDLSGLRRALRRARQQVSPNRVNLTARRLGALFAWERETHEPAGARATELVRNAIAELDQDDLRDILQATVVEGVSVAEYAERPGESPSRVQDRRARAVRQVNGIIGWLPQRQLTDIQAAVESAAEYAAQKRAEPKGKETPRPSGKTRKPPAGGRSSGARPRGQRP